MNSTPQASRPTPLSVRSRLSLATETTAALEPAMPADTPVPDVDESHAGALRRDRSRTFTVHVHLAGEVVARVPGADGWGVGEGALHVYGPAPVEGERDGKLATFAKGTWDDVVRASVEVVR